MEILDGAIDLADPRDYPHDEVFGSEETPLLPSRFIHARSPILNQGRTMECTIFSATGAMNELNGIEQESFDLPYQETLTTDTLKQFCYKYGFTDAKGGPITGPLDALRKDLRLLVGYTVVTRQIDAVKRAIMKSDLCSGSNKIVWSSLPGTNFIVESYSSGPGHAFRAVGWDDNFQTAKHGNGVFIFANSYGTEYGRDLGYFYIPYAIVFDVLFTIHFPVDASNASPLLRYKAKLKGIWNGERENENMTRYEGYLMAQRTRPEYTGNIWNEKEPDANVIRQDFVTMLSRVVGKTVEWNRERGLDPITRGEAAELCAKYL